MDATKTSFRIIEELKQSGDLRVTELATELNMPKSTAFKHLATLQDLGYVHKDTHVYSLSYKFVELGEFVRQENDLYMKGRDEIEGYTEFSEEVIGLFIEDNGVGVDIYQRGGEKGDDSSTPSINTSYLHASAAGKVILAFLPKTRVDEIIDHNGLPDLAHNTITERGELEEELSRIRNREIAYEKEEQRNGYNSIASPILVNENTLQGAVYICGPTNLMPAQRMQQNLFMKVKKITKNIENKFQDL